MELTKAFVKTTSPVSEKIAKDGALKAELNRKGNALFNSGDIEGAKRIFRTTGYSDGLVRVGDFYLSKGKPIDALRMYYLAPDRKKADPLIQKAAQVIQELLKQ
ncbi:MAG: hypothetical protein LBM77_13355 [Spirochaetaceae bacterium]|jgi:hypothetical protein|nr:hypothetical protein [Spirochaetaceae bacterium]